MIKLDFGLLPHPEPIFGPSPVPDFAAAGER